MIEEAEKGSKPYPKCSHTISRGNIPVVTAGCNIQRHVYNELSKRFNVALIDDSDSDTLSGHILLEAEKIKDMVIESEKRIFEVLSERLNVLGRLSELPLDSSKRCSEVISKAMKPAAGKRPPSIEAYLDVAGDIGVKLRELCKEDPYAPSHLNHIAEKESHMLERGAAMMFNSVQLCNHMMGEIYTQRNKELLDLLSRIAYPEKRIVKEVAEGALLHDCGMLHKEIADIANSNINRLTDCEKTLVDRHVKLAMLALKNENIGSMVKQIIEGHHLKKGNPEYDEQETFIKALRLVNIYSAMASDRRPYRLKVMPVAALYEILSINVSNGEADLHHAKKFFEAFTPFMVSAEIETERGFCGKILRINPQNPCKPVVKLNSYRSGENSFKPLPKRIEVDLSRPELEKQCGPIKKYLGQDVKGYLYTLDAFKDIK
jgi:hypothetical protein